jgi:sugar phosphate isomerase/epimerase
MRLINEFGMDTISLAGPIEAKLAAMQAAGFAQVMLKANDLVGHAQGWQAAVHACRASGMRPTSFQVLRDFEGLSGHLHDYKVEIAKNMLQMAHRLDAKVLLVCSSVSAHATHDMDAIVRDLRKLAMLALPLGIKIAYEALSWGRTINEMPQSWDVVCRADMPNLGICVDSYHVLAAKTSLEEIDFLDPSKIFLVQLADFMWNETKTFEERMTTARTYRVFPGEGVHSEQLVELVQRLEKIGYRGDYSFEVFNDDYLNMPLEFVCERAKKSALWLAEDVLRRSTPLPGEMRLKARNLA